MATVDLKALVAAAREFATLSRRKKIIYSITLGLTLIVLWLELQFPEVIDRWFGVVGLPHGPWR